MNRSAPSTPKCQIACSYCRGRKVRCTGGARCRNCIDHGKECVYPLPQRKKRKKDGPENVLLERRLAQVEALLQLPKGNQVSEIIQNPPMYEQPQESASTAYSHSIQPPPRPGQSQNDHLSPANTLIGFAGSARFDARRDSIASLRAQSPPAAFCRADSATIRSFVGSSAVASDSYHGESTNTSPEMHLDKEESIISPYNVNWEHHGPGSWVSICSYPGIQWVTARTGVPDFAKAARGLTVGFTRRLKLESNMNRQKAPELDPETAWRYATAYFEECHYAVIGCVHRPIFESRLRAQFAEPSEFVDDPSWFALRNTVYASGCRILMAKDHMLSFNQAQAQSWMYFENALSVHTELLYTPTGLTAVQALTLMSYYVEGLGSPVLEYMLCANAARLAQSKGLHRQAARAWNLPESEVLHRNWLFWAIYIMEKAISSRSGRPSAIDDDDISCQIPTEIVPESTIDIDIFTAAIKHAQISSLISKKLTSVSAFRRTPMELIEKVNELNQALEEWRSSLPHHLQPGALRCLPKMSKEKDQINLTLLHYAYYGSLMAIHTVFTYPWITTMFGPNPAPAIREQVSISTSTVAEAARNIILSTRHSEMDAASPAWLSFFFPMVGLINLFVSILKDPAAPTAQSDVALMDSAAGHFGHMEFISSSELAFPFTREIAALARSTVVRVREGYTIGPTHSEANTVREASANMEVDPWHDLDVLSAIDFDMENWNVFSMPMDDLSGGNEVAIFQG